MVNTLGLGLGLLLTLVVVVLHVAKGTEKSTPEDLAQEVLQRRAATVPETGFPEPMNRAPGGGSVPAGAVVTGETEGELEEAEEETGFDPAAIPEDEVEYYDVEFLKEGETIEVASNETILEAGEDEGWDLPYACREGQCLSCGGHVTSGDAQEFIQHSNNEMLNDQEMEDGYCLTCVAYPTADLSIETGEAP